MNQHQRKFLLEAVEKQHTIEKHKLKDRKPSEPSLNNYLIAAILDGSFVLHPPELIRASILKRVRDLGKSDTLVTSESQWNRSTDTGTTSDMISLPAQIMFKLPPDYAVELERYEAAKAQWDAECIALESSISAMRIKVQIGSDKALNALVEQADSLCTMSLADTNRLMLSR